MSGSASAARRPGYVIDEFDAYTRVFREVRLWRWASVGLTVLLLLLLAVILVMALQPPVVIVKDRATTDAPAVVHPGEKPPLTALDAENFFFYVLRRRYGWDSPTVVRDFEELHTLMTKDMGAAFSSYVNAIVPAQAPAGQLPDPNKSVPRVISWMQSMTHNQIALDRNNVDCRQGEPVNGVEQWYCRAFGYIETSPLGHPLAEASGARKRVEFRARFQPAPYDKFGVRLWGLAVAYLDALNAEEK